MKATAVIAIIGASVIGMGVANAQTFSLKVNGFAGDNHETVKIKLDGEEQTVNAGPFSAQLNGGDSFTAYCVDLRHTSTFGSSFDVNVKDAGEAGVLSNGGLAAQLFNKFSGSVHDSSSGAALQLAIWWSLYNGTDLSPNGRFQIVDASADVLTDLKLIATTGVTGASTHANFYGALSHGAEGRSNQNLIGGGAVPEPATMAAMALGLVGIARRRRQGKK